MDQLPIPDLRLIPYTQASKAQLAQALVTAKEALHPYYPTLAWPRWHQAFEQLRPVLQVETDQVSLTTESFTRLARYFDSQLIAPSLPVAQSPSAILLSQLSTQMTLPATALFSSSSPLKKTYSIHPEVLELLNRVSFWQRKGKSTLVNLALMRFLSDYAESKDPIPSTEP